MKNKFTPQGSDNLKIEKEILNEIKHDYVYGKETKSLLFKKYNRKYNIDRFTFMSVINNINQELGINQRSSVNKKASWLIDSRMEMNLKPQYYNPYNVNHK
jgi:hypothetical protein